MEWEEIWNEMCYLKSYKGYPGLVCCVKRVREDESRLHDMTGQVYLPVAKEMGIGLENLERNLRTVRDVFEDHGGMTGFREHLGGREEFKIYPRELIAVLAEYASGVIWEKQKNKCLCQEKTLDRDPPFLYDKQGGERTMEKIVEQTLLYDFYGELLTDHQKQVYEDVVFNDLSLSEAAEERGVSRQGIHDLIKRCNRILQEYEEKLGLVEKFLRTREKVEEIHQLTKEFRKTKDEGLVAKIEAISGEISRL